MEKPWLGCSVCFKTMVAFAEMNYVSPVGVEGNLSLGVKKRRKQILSRGLKWKSWLLLVVFVERHFGFMLASFFVEFAESVLQVTSGDVSQRAFKHFDLASCAFEERSTLCVQGPTACLNNV